MVTINKLLELARKQRESGKPEAALNTFNKILLLAQKSGQHVEVIEAFTDRAITFRHMYEEAGDIVWAILSRKDAETILEMVKMWGVSEKLHTAYYLLGQASLLFKDYADAENYFFKSLRYFKGNSTEKGSWRYHWAKALYMVGEKKRALFGFSHALNEIKKNSGSADEFLVHVYLSGAYMSFAQVLKKDDSATAKKYFDMAKEIIDSDKRLVVRKKQLLVLKKCFK